MKLQDAASDIAKQLMCFVSYNKQHQSVEYVAAALGIGLLKLFTIINHTQQMILTRVLRRVVLLATFFIESTQLVC